MILARTSPYLTFDIASRTFEGHPRSVTLACPYLPKVPKLVVFCGFLRFLDKTCGLFFQIDLLFLGLFTVSDANQGRSLLFLSGDFPGKSEAVPCRDATHAKYLIKRIRR